MTPTSPIIQEAGKLPLQPRSLREWGETGVLMWPLPDNDNTIGNSFEAISSYTVLPITKIYVVKHL